MGRVVAWEAALGYGFIAGAGYRSLVVHASDLLDGMQRLIIGMDVSFELGRIGDRPSATNVRVE